jgi:surface carbohydrate biosynthesis protein
MKNFKIFFKAKWEFFPPKKRALLIYDGNNNPFSELMNRYDFNILYTRGEKLNLTILILCFFKKKFNSNNYIKEYLRFAKPKLVLTFIDNNPKFYGIHKYGSFKTAFVQNGIRTKFSDIFSDKYKVIVNKKNKKNFKVDFMFVFNSKIGKLYNSFIKGNAISIGSFKNNLSKINNKKENKILIISTFRDYKKDRLVDDGINWGEFTKNDDFFVKWLVCFANKYKIKIDVLGRYSLSQTKKEFTYFKKFFGKNNFNFIENDIKKSSHKVIDKYKYCFTIDSTLGIENLVRGGRVGFFSNRSNKYPIISRKFGWMEKFKKKGLFWTYENDKKELERIFKTVVFSDQKKWNSLTKKYQKNIMSYDFNNVKFNKIVNKILNKYK